MLQFLHYFCQNLQSKKLLTSNQSLLVAVSGGQDSMCLLFFLYIIKRHRRIVFDVIWCHHFWQKSSFFAMCHVAKSSYSFSVQSILCLPLHNMLSEQNARNWRHTVIQRAHIFYNYDLCAYGHNKSDRVETVFFNLIRGAGIIGISALPRKKQKTCFVSNTFYPTLFDLAHKTHVKTVDDALLCVDLVCFSRSASKRIEAHQSASKRIEATPISVFCRNKKYLEIFSRLSTH